MPAISFSTLKDKIISDEKKQTIRPLETDYWLRWEEGDRLVGYWKQRTEQCEKLFESKFAEDPREGTFADWGEAMMLDRLAALDGFEYTSDMIEWFSGHYGNNFWEKDFVIIRWN